MARFGLLPWQRDVVIRLEESLGRTLIAGDLDSIAWNADQRTLAVYAPLLGELRRRNLISNIFRG